MSSSRLLLPFGFSVGYGNKVVAHCAEPVSIGSSEAPGSCSITLVVGANGSGKTTLLRTLAGLLPTIRGEALLDGIPMAQIQTMESLCYLPEELAFFGELCAGHVLRTLAHNGAEARNVAGRFGLPLDVPYHRLSKGQRQKLRLALALEASTRARFVLLDEPMSGLDIDARQMVMEMLRTVFSGRGKRLFVSMHTEKLPQGWCDSTIGLHEGILRAGPAFTSVYEAHDYFQRAPTHPMEQAFA